MRSSRLLPLALALALGTFSCSSSGRAGALPPGQDIGVPLQTRPILHFEVVGAAPEKFLEQTLLVEARVEAVCQQMGCWMQVRDGQHAARVRWESGCGGEYAFPKDAAGKRILIQGSFHRKTTTPEEAEHLQQESGSDVVKPGEGYEFNASAVRVLD